MGYDIIIILCVLSPVFCSGWERRRLCTVTEWSVWTGCSRECGNAGEQTRSRIKITAGVSCPYSLIDMRPCNRFCHNNGIPKNQGCACLKPYTGRCCDGVFSGNKTGLFIFLGIPK